MVWMTRRSAQGRAQFMRNPDHYEDGMRRPYPDIDDRATDFTLLELFPSVATAVMPPISCASLAGHMDAAG